MAKQRRSNRKVHRGRRKKRGFSTWSLGKKIGVIFVSMLLVIVIGGGAAAAAYVTARWIRWKSSSWMLINWKLIKK